MRDTTLTSATTILQGRYELEQLLGQGGFGAVYRAYDRRLQTTVAIKETFDHSSEAAQQFEFEARLLAGLRHPALPAVTDYFMEQDGQYLVMGYVPGEDLSSHLAHQPQGRMQVAAIMPILAPLLDALEYMHSHVPPIIHRDIKPDNIRITPEGQVFLVDFGLAKAYNPGLKTTAGARAVTPGFAPLEQYGMGTTDVRSDLYALGATLYTLLSGTEVPEAPQRALQDTLLPLRRHNPDVPTQLEAVVMRLLAMQPADRYPDVATLRRDLPAIPEPAGKLVQTHTHREAQSAARPAPATDSAPGAGITTRVLTPALPDNLTYAALWRRVAATLLDGMLILVCSMLLGEVIGLTLRLLPTIAAWLIGALVIWLYYPLLESSGWQATVGKRLLGLAVTDLYGNRISFGHALVRHIYRLASAMILPALAFLLRLVRRPDLVVVLLALVPLLFANFSATRQAFHDWMTGCVVVQLRREA